MRVPVTDAFDDIDQLESLEVKLTSEQIAWLKQTADERDLSPDHVLRTILTAQMRDDEAAAPPPASGDSIPHSPDEQPTPSRNETVQTANDGSSEDSESSKDGETSSIVESLRSASERLQDLTEDEDEAKEPDQHDTLDRLRSHVDSTPDSEHDSTKNDPGTVLMDDAPSRSMFDMMEE